MNDGYGGFNMDSYGNQYKPQTSALQQSGQGFLDPTNPCSPNYDPTAHLMHQARQHAYNPTAGSTLVRGVQHSAYQAMMPSTLGATTGTPNHALHNSAMPTFDPILFSNALHRLSPQNQHMNSNRASSIASTRAPAPVPRDVAPSPLSDLFDSEEKTKQEPWLEGLKLEVSGISLEPLPGSVVIARIESRTEQVRTKYLPCVDFLVECQQDLRKGLAAATSKQVVHGRFRDAMTPRQFYNQFIAPLPERFYRRNKRTMKSDDLNTAVKEIQKLCQDARAVERQGCEVVKNTFLGGMKDGESWGLRRWLSKQGGALHICNDCECILQGCQKLDRSLESTRKLGAKLRPMAKQSLNKLKRGIPPSYQETSSAHPYLPFFHRLESALRGLSNFDPEDDDVICIVDDDEVEEMKAKAASKPKSIPSSRKRKTQASAFKPSTKRAASKPRPATVANSDDDSVIEILDVKPGPRQSPKPSVEDDSSYMKELLEKFEDDDSTTDFFEQMKKQDGFALFLDYC